MITIEKHETTFESYLENIAVENLSDEQYDDFQGLYIKDKVRFLMKSGFNLKPLAFLNGIYV